MRLKNILLVSIFIFLFSLSLVFVSANSVVFESYVETAEIESKNNVHETIEVIINIGEVQDFINFSLTPRISNLEVLLDDKKADCEIIGKLGVSDVLCFLDGSVSGKHFLQIDFDSSYPLISLKENKLMFRSSYEPLIETKNFIFILKLPLGYIIPEEPGRDKSFFINPHADNLYSDGQRIILRWEEKTLNEKFEVSVISEQIPKSKLNLIRFFIFVLIGVIIFWHFYLKNKLKQKRTKVVKKKRESKAERIEKHLIESEKTIINELRNADKKELWQKQLQLKTGFSKAKLSRVIRNLEARNIIKKIPFGNTNTIKLKIN